MLKINENKTNMNKAGRILSPKIQQLSTFFHSQFKYVHKFGLGLHLVLEYADKRFCILLIIRKIH